MTPLGIIAYAPFGYEPLHDRKTPVQFPVKWGITCAHYEHHLAFLAVRCVLLLNRSLLPGMAVNKYKRPFFSSTATTPDAVVTKKKAPDQRRPGTLEAASDAGQKRLRNPVVLGL